MTFWGGGGVPVECVEELCIPDFRIKVAATINNIPIILMLK